MNFEYLNDLRRAEVEKLWAFMPKGARVLEFGAGTGEQAAFLADKGFDVIAIDLLHGDYSKERVFPVEDYDGRHIPLEAESVDIIFSSNVLEHVENLPEIFSEFRRILRPGGFGLHVVPTSAWRFWTFVAGPFASGKTLVRLLLDLIRRNGPVPLLRSAKQVLGPLLPIAHGTGREGISELWTFSSRAWRTRFRKSGWMVSSEQPIGIFYTGNALFGPALSFERRETFSKYLGSGSQVYVIRPAGT